MFPPPKKIIIPKRGSSSLIPAKIESEKAEPEFYKKNEDSHLCSSIKFG